MLNVAIDTGVQMLKDFGGQLIDTEFSKLIEEGIKAASAGLGILSGGVDALCGLIPFAGAAVCAATVTTGLKLIWEYAGAPNLREFALGTVRGWFNDLANWLGNQVRIQLKAPVQAAAAAAQQTIGPFAAQLTGLVTTVVNFVQKTLMPIVEKMTGINDALRGYMDLLP